MSATQFWVYIERDHNQDVAVGPFTTKRQADKELESGEVTNDICHEDCLDAYVVPGYPEPEADRVQPTYLVVADNPAARWVQLQSSKA